MKLTKLTILTLGLMLMVCCSRAYSQTGEFYSVEEYPFTIDKKELERKFKRLLLEEFTKEYFTGNIFTFDVEVDSLSNIISVDGIRKGDDPNLILKIKSLILEQERIVCSWCSMKEVLPKYYLMTFYVSDEGVKFSSTFSF